jgi:FkbM family methyltransferase
MPPRLRQVVIGGAQRLSWRLPPRVDREVRELARMVIPHHGQRLSLARRLGFALLRRRSPYLVVPFGAGHLVVDSRDDEIGRAVFLTGGYERWHMETALSALAEAGRRVEGTVFVDAGANIGTSTVDALLWGGFGRAVCFEPEPGNASLLAANLALNGVADRADAHVLALSDADCAAVLQRSARNSGDHRVAAPGGNGWAGRQEEKVHCRRLDGLVEEGLVDPEAVGLFWADTQGHELRVLRGAATLAQAGVPHVIEFCPWLLGDDAPELEEHVASRFSRIIDLHAEAEVSPARLPELRRMYRRRGYTDLLLVP